MSVSCKSNMDLVNCVNKLACIHDLRSLMIFAFWKWNYGMYWNKPCLPRLQLVKDKTLVKQELVPSQSLSIGVICLNGQTTPCTSHVQLHSKLDSSSSLVLWVILSYYTILYLGLNESNMNDWLPLLSLHLHFFVPTNLHLSKV